MQDGDSDKTPARPAPSQPAKSGSGGFITFLLFFAVLGVAGYLAWPVWSPYVAPYVPELEYRASGDPRIAGLADRLTALEENTTTRDANSLAAMEKERKRLQDEINNLLGRLNGIEGALKTVRQMISATGDSASPAVTEESLDRMNQRLSALEKEGGDVETLTRRLTKLEEAGTGAVEAAPADDDALASVNRRLAELEQSGADVPAIEERLQRLESAQSSAPAPDGGSDAAIAENARLSTAVDALRQRLADLEARPAATNVGVSKPSADGPGAAIVLAVGQLRSSVLSGSSFAKDLQSLKALAGDDAGMAAPISVLDKHAAAGVATLTDLQSQFRSAADGIVSVSRRIDGDGWLERTVNSFVSLVSIRRTDGGDGSGSIDSLVAKAEQELAAGNLAGAVESVEQVKASSPPAFKAAENWLTSAKNRLSSERAMATLHVHAVSLVAARAD